MIYFDNAATTKPLQISLKTYVEINENNFANPSSLHKTGKKSKQIIDYSKEIVKKILNVKQGEIIFTPSATLSNNIAIKGIIEYLKSRIKNRKVKIMFSESDHPSIVEPLKKEKDVELKDISLQNLYENIKKNIDIQDYIFNHYCEKINEFKPDFIVLQWVNNENGLLSPVEKIIEYAKKNIENIFVHVDAVQGFMKIPLLNIKFIDTLSFSAHKFGGLKGTSVLYIKDISAIKPIIFGGGQMLGIFPSTENVPAIASLVSLIEYLYPSIVQRLENTIKKNEYLVYLISKDEEISNLFYIFCDNIIENINFSPYIIKIYNKKIPAQVLQNLLSEKDIMVSIGSACSSNKKKNFMDTANFGIPSEFADKGIRISFFIDESEEQIDKFYVELKNIIYKFKNW